jgi:hypothetical protein
MNSADTKASTWEDEMSHRIDILPSRRRSRVRRILMPAGEGGLLSSTAGRCRGLAEGLPTRSFLFRVLDKNAINPFGIFDRDVVGHHPDD